MVRHAGSGQPSWLPTSEHDVNPFSTGHAESARAPLSVVPETDSVRRFTHGAMAADSEPEKVHVSEQPILRYVNDAGNVGSAPDSPCIVSKVMLVRLDSAENPAGMAPLNLILKIDSIFSAGGVGSEPVMAEFTMVNDANFGRLESTSRVPFIDHEWMYKDVSSVSALNDAGSEPAKLSPSNLSDCSAVSEPMDDGIKPRTHGWE